MLKLALDAQLPLVAVTTRDIINLPDVLVEVAKKPLVKFDPNAAKPNPSTLFYYVCTPGIQLPLVKLYEKMVHAESTLLLVNPDRMQEPMFNAGEVPVPRSIMMKFMTAIVDDEKIADGLLRGLGGCTVKEAAELARLTMARDKSLTVQGIMATRKSSFQASSGLTQVDAKQSFYNPPEALAKWVASERGFFLHGKDPRLIPRGLLMDGPPGTGKTAGAKYVADQWGIPLYRVDIGGTKNKYVGESEQNMLTNLSRLDHEEPCVALLDEVEKIFSTNNNDTSGTTSTMLSQLLWWLAERKSRVLVMMTTNKAKVLPKELYREGRIDKVLNFDGLSETDAPMFVKQVLATFDKGKHVTDDAVAAILKRTVPLDESHKRYAQAALTSETYAYMKTVQKPKA